MVLSDAKDRILDNYGRLACTVAQLNSVAPDDLIRVRRSSYGCEGLVVHGEGRGTGLGFPTANIAIPDTMLPAPGVYATRVVVPHLGKTLQAVTNIGRKPTFGDYGLSIESFLLDTDLNLYGSELRLDFVARLRDEKRFDSADALVAQIRTDVARARDLLTMYF